MIPLFRILLCGLCSTALSRPAAAESFLVKDGKAQAQIVVGDEPGRAAKFAARELQTHVEQITGARLAIVAQATGDAPVKIYVGRNAGAARPELSTAELKHGAFRMNSGAGWLALLGNDQEFTPPEPWPRKRSDLKRAEKEWDKITGDTFAHPHPRLYQQYNQTFDLWDFDDRGTINAVHEFLRDLGVRWYFPGDLGTIVPRRDSIPLPSVNKIVRPDFPLRAMGVYNANTFPEVFLWQTRMGVNYPADLLGLAQVCHGTKFITMRDEMKAAHPEIYRVDTRGRVTDNKKGQGSPCLSTPGFREKQGNFVRAMFDHFQSGMVSLDVSDGFRPCLCDRCQGTTQPEQGEDGLLSEYVWGYVNGLARDLHRTHPDDKVSGLSYGRYRNPPKNAGPLSPNVTLVYCQHRNAFGDAEVREKFVNRRNEWLKILTSKSMYTFDFHLLSDPDSAWSGVPAYFPREIADDIRSLKGVSLGDFLSVAYHAHPDRYPWDALAVDHLNDYVTSRFWWDADQDLEALLAEYFRDLYGPASDEMKAYVEYCSKNWRRMLTDVEPIIHSQQLLQRARAAAGETIHGQRVARVAAYTARLDEIRNRMTRKRENVPGRRALTRDPADLKLDGKLDDKFWTQTRSPQLVDLRTGNTPRLRTRVHLASTRNGNLFLGLHCDEPDMKHLAVTTEENDDSAIRKGDFIDILIETQTHSYYQITLNPAGAIMDVDHRSGKKPNLQWQSNAEVAVHHCDGFWTAEIRLPCAGPMAEEIDPDDGISGRVPTKTYPWHINVGRQRVRGKDIELSAWSPTGSDRFDIPEKFAMLYTK